MDHTRTVAVEHDGAIVRVTISRPEKRNALALATVAELIEAIDGAGRDPAARLVVLTGAGDRAFAAGADLDELAQVAGSAGRAREYDGIVTGLYDAIERSPLPVIARIQASAMGGGCLLALACDLRIAAASAQFGIPAGRIGVMLSEREHRLLVETVGSTRARLLLFTARRLDAAQALACGLIDEIVAPDALDDRVATLANEIVQCAPRAVAAAKCMVRGISQGTLSEEMLSSCYRDIYESDDLREGIAAFKARRAPVFLGR